MLTENATREQMTYVSAMGERGLNAAMPFIWDWTLDDGNTMSDDGLTFNVWGKVVHDNLMRPFDANEVARAAPQNVPFWSSGAMTVRAGVGRFYFHKAAVIEAVVATVPTAPTGASAIFDVHKNGTTIFTTQSARPTVPASANVSNIAVPAVRLVAAGEYITVDIDQIGSTVAGSDPTVTVRYREVGTP